ncbi:MAG: gluconokinase [Verrucomicrobiales bacterium]
MTPFIVVMGVSGCGKSTVAGLLAEAIDGTYLEGDAFHPPENKEKMGAGIPLTDDDRWPWFDALIGAANHAIAEGSVPVLACSALKRIHRDYLFRNFEDNRLVHLAGSFDLIKSRMDDREHEYMTSDLLRSQFDALEEPEPDPNVLIVPIEPTPEEQVALIVDWLD